MSEFCQWVLFSLIDRKVSVGIYQPRQHGVTAEIDDTSANRYLGAGTDVRNHAIAHDDDLRLQRSAVYRIDEMSGTDDDQGRFSPERANPIARKRSRLTTTLDFMAALFQEKRSPAKYFKPVSTATVATRHPGPSSRAN